RESAYVVSTGFFGQTIGQPRVVGGAQKEHESCSWKDASKDELIGHLQNEAKEPCQYQQIDENVGAKSEVSVPVARGPDFWFVVGHGGFLGEFREQARERRERGMSQSPSQRCRLERPPFSVPFRGTLGSTRP